jgi:thiamine biosynthesis lipoprotein
MSAVVRRSTDYVFPLIKKTILYFFGYLGGSRRAWQEYNKKDAYIGDSMKKYIYAFFIVLIAIVAFGCGQPKPYKETQFLMDTVIEITAYGPNAQEAVKEAFGEFKRIETLSDRFNPESQLSKINQASGKEKVVVDPELTAIIQRAVEVSRKSKGKFDITVGALTDLWGIGKKDSYIPSQMEIDKTLPLVDYQMVEVDVEHNQVFLPKQGMILDLGGIAKRQAIDKAVEKLKAMGIQSALVNDGGDINVIGNRPDGKPWRIGVQHPRKPDALLAKITLSQWDTVETSGDYQRYFMKDNIRYAHIIDPATGRQPREITSVTLISKNGGADIRSSAIFVLGVEQGLEVLKRYPGTEAIIVATDGRVIVTPGLGNSVEIKN